jgi:putative transposase
MFMDEAGFGRISEPSYCWCPEGVRPVVPRHRVREYVYTYGAVDPVNGDGYYIIAPKCTTEWTNEFLKLCSYAFKDDHILMCTDNASWHRSNSLKVPENIMIHYLPAYTPEMNPIEQIWKEVRKGEFKNTMFCTLNDVVDKLSRTLMSVTKDTIKSICGRDWIVSMFN